MAPIDSTPDGALPDFRPALRVLFIRTRYSRARCPSGDAWKDKRNVHERTTLKRSWKDKRNVHERTTLKRNV